MAEVVVAAEVAKVHADLLEEVRRRQVIYVVQKSRRYAISQQTWKHVTRAIRKLVTANLVWLDDREGLRYPVYKLTPAGELACEQNTASRTAGGDQR